MSVRAWTLIGVVGLGIAVTASTAARSQVRSTGRCEVDATPSPVASSPPVPTPTGSPSTPITLTAKATGFYFDLANNRKAQRRTIDVEASGSLSAERQLCVTLIGDFLTSDAHGSLSGSMARMSALIDRKNPRLIRVTVKLVPNKRSVDTFRSGAFNGTIRLAGVGIEKVDIPISITLRSGSNILGPTLAILAILLGIGLGSLARWRSKQGQAAAEENKQAKQVAAEAGEGAPAPSRWQTTGARVLLGVATAMGVVLVGWSTQFLDNLTFGTAGFTDWMALGLWGFAAGYAGKTITDYLPAAPAKLAVVAPVVATVGVVGLPPPPAPPAPVEPDPKKP